MTILDVNDSCLLVIDMQTNFYKQSRTDVDTAALHAVFEVGAWVTGVARSLGVPTIVTEEDAATNDTTIPLVAKELGESAQVLPKCAFGAPANPAILRAIEETGRSSAVVIGMETDVCVAHTALGLHDLGKRVAVVHDATYSPGAAHANGLSRLRAAGVELLSAKELFYDWLPAVDVSRDFHRRHPGFGAPPGFHL